MKYIGVKVQIPLEYVVYNTQKGELKLNDRKTKYMTISKIQGQERL